ncbi:hypothetical protein [Pseudooceanicola sp. MF1-13]|uniref:hypothetical protein n=1 Tax=Pseudooceanicola sp. MF1-13 TaxID=3379095 RepID=UPI0038923DB6
MSLWKLTQPLAVLILSTAAAMAQPKGLAAPDAYGSLTARVDQARTDGHEMAACVLDGRIEELARMVAVLGANTSKEARP